MEVIYSSHPMSEACHPSHSLLEDICPDHFMSEVNHLSPFSLLEVNLSSLPEVSLEAFQSRPLMEACPLFSPQPEA